MEENLRPSQRAQQNRGACVGTPHVAEEEQQEQQEQEQEQQEQQEQEQQQQEQQEQAEGRPRGRGRVARKAVEAGVKGGEAQLRLWERALGCTLWAGQCASVSVSSYETLISLRLPRCACVTMRSLPRGTACQDKCSPSYGGITRAMQCHTARCAHAHAGLTLP